MPATVNKFQVLRKRFYVVVIVVGDVGYDSKVEDRALGKGSIVTKNLPDKRALPFWGGATRVGGVGVALGTVEPESQLTRYPTWCHR